jgi:hypothetical protein
LAGILCFIGIPTALRPCRSICRRTPTAGGGRERGRFQEWRRRKRWHGGLAVCHRELF